MTDMPAIGWSRGRRGREAVTIISAPPAAGRLHCSTRGPASQARTTGSPSCPYGRASAARSCSGSRCWARSGPRPAAPNADRTATPRPRATLPHREADMGTSNRAAADQPVFGRRPCRAPHPVRVQRHPAHQRRPGGRWLACRGLRRRAGGLGRRHLRISAARNHAAASRRRRQWTGPGPAGGGVPLVCGVASGRSQRHRHHHRRPLLQPWPDRREYPLSIRQGRIGDDVLSLHSAFPDLDVIVADMFAEHDKVVTRVIARGTHLGPLHTSRRLPGARPNPTP
jgi:hypothetical protein